MLYIESTNPADQYKMIGSVMATPVSEVVKIVQESRLSYRQWSNTSLGERIVFLRSLYDIFDENREKIAQSVSGEMGMPIKYARDDIGYGLAYFLWYLDNAEKYLSPEIVFENDTELHTVFYEPRGVIAAITPWNYPFMLCIWACIQPLLAGNTVIWKISKEVILTGKLIGDIILSSSLPSGVWTSIYGDGKIGDILTDQDIDGVTFTGSTRVGQLLAKKASEKGIPAVMELGGSAPGIICEDADIDSVLETIWFMRFSNSGQMCDGLKRLIIHQSRYEEFLSKMHKKMLSKTLGNPLKESTDMGPLASEGQKNLVQEQLQDALSRGAKIHTIVDVGSELQGAYISPVLLTDIQLDMRVWKEEVFGPILPVVTYIKIDEAIDLANDTIYGLGAYVFTENRENFEYIAHKIDTGMVQMNTVNYCIPSDPFGGQKASGIGREHGKWGFYEMTKTKVLSRSK